MDNITHGNSKDNYRALMELLKPEGFRRVCRALEHEIGTAEASLYAELLGRFEYFQDRGQLDDDGYFFNTVLDLQHGTALSGKRQRSTITRLEQLQLIKTKLKGVPPKRYFKIVDNEEQLLKYLKNGKVKMDALKEQANKQKGKVEADRLNGEGCFNPKYKRISKCANMEDFNYAQREDLNMPIKQTNKNKVNKNKKEEAAAATYTQTEKQKIYSVYLNCYQDKTGVKVENINKQNRAALKKLIDRHGLEKASNLLKVWFEKADKGTIEELFPVNYLLNDEAIYLVKVKEYEEEADQRARQEEAQRQRDAEYRQEEEVSRKEEARRAALTDEERRLEDIARRRDTLDSIITLRERMAADGCQESKIKLQEAKQELYDLAAEEAQLLPQVKEA